MNLKTLLILSVYSFLIATGCGKALTLSSSFSSKAVPTIPDSSLLRAQAIKIGTPVLQSSDAGLFLSQSESGKYSININAGGKASLEYAGYIVVNRPFITLASNSIEADDTYEPYINYIFFKLKVSGAGSDSINFSIPKEAIFFINLTSTEKSMYVGPDKILKSETIAVINNEAVVDNIIAAPEPAPIEPTPEITPVSSADLSILIGKMNLVIDGASVGSNSFDGGLENNEEEIVIGASNGSEVDQNNKIVDPFVGSLNGELFDSLGESLLSFSKSDNENYNTVSSHISYQLTQGIININFTATDISGTKTLISKDASGYSNGGHLRIYLDNGEVRVRLQSDSQSYTLRSGFKVVANKAYKLEFGFGASDTPTPIADTTPITPVETTPVETGPITIVEPAPIVNLGLGDWAYFADNECGSVGTQASMATGCEMGGRREVFNSDKFAHTGKRSMEMGIFEGTTGDRDLYAAFKFTHASLKNGRNLKQGDEFWHRTWYYFPVGFDFTASGSGLKLSRVNTVAKGSSDTEQWITMHIRPSGLGFGNAVNHVMFTANKDTTHLKSIPPTKGKWMAVEQYIKFHSEPGKAVYRVWQNGELVFNDTVTNTLTSSTSEVDKLALFTYWNGGAPQTQQLYVDDFMATNTTPSHVDANGYPYIGLTNEF